MRTLGTVAALSTMLLAACAAKPESTLPPPHIGLRLTTPDVARRSGAHAQHVDLPFRLLDRGVNGTALLIGFLQRVEGHGARYASELSYALQMRYEGRTIECVSKIVVGGDHPRAPVEIPTAAPDPSDGEVEYTTTVKPWTPRVASAWVVDRKMVCKRHAQQVAVREPRYPNRYNAEIGRYKSPGQMPIETTKIVHYDECTFEPARRFVQRYEHFVASRFSPPELPLLQRQYADGPLTQEPPLCHEIQLAPGQALRQHIVADVHFATMIEPLRENEYVRQAPVRSVGGE